MIGKRHIACGALLVSGIVGFAVANSNIDPVNKFSWGENIGYLNWRDANNGSDGVQVFSDHLAGYVWAENVGWINVGNGGGPYANTDNTDFGVNVSPSGNLSGFAWGENIGWINFGGGALATPAQPASIDFSDDRFRGYAWGENVGWINLDDGSTFVGIDPTPMTLCSADVDGDFDVDVDDFVILTGEFGDPACPSSGCAADIDMDNDVDFDDFILLTAQFGNNSSICMP